MKLYQQHEERHEMIQIQVSHQTDTTANRDPQHSAMGKGINESPNVFLQNVTSQAHFELRSYVHKQNF